MLMMENSKHKAGLIALFVVLLGVGVFFILNSDTKTSTDGTAFDTGEWQTYRSEEFDFEIKYPPSWSVAESDEIAPMISIYKAGQSGAPFNHFANALHMSIYPHGIPTEGVQSERQEASVKVKGSSKANDLLLENGNVFASSYTFEELPASWEPWGFLWARGRIDNQGSKCIKDGEEIPREECDIFEGDSIVVTGSVSASERALIEAMLQTFTFTN